EIATSETLRYMLPNGDHGGTLRVDPVSGDTWVSERLFGGFRYLLVRMASAGDVELRRLRLRSASIAAGPDACTGSFACSDDVITRLWYAAVYTAQINTTAPFVPALPNGRKTARGWVLDGPKRDRLYWTGDLLIEAPVLFISSGNYARDAVRHCLEVIA